MKTTSEGRIALRVPKELSDRIHQVAEQARWSVSTVVEVCIESQLPNLEREVAEAIARQAVHVVLSNGLKKPSPKK